MECLFFCVSTWPYWLAFYGLLLVAFALFGGGM